MGKRFCFFFQKEALSYFLGVVFMKIAALSP